MPRSRTENGQIMSLRMAHWLVRLGRQLEVDDDIIAGVLDGKMSVQEARDLIRWRERKADA